MNKRKTALILCESIMMLCVVANMISENFYIIASNIFSISFIALIIIAIFGRKKKHKNNKYNINFDSMSGHDFERLCADILKDS